MRAYLRAALAACRMGAVAPSFLLHPLDFLGGEEVPALGFFPAMNLTRGAKMAAVREVMTILQEESGNRAVPARSTSRQPRPASSP
jgi:hypothetical protein